MKKSEKLELENKVLKNMLENIQCEIGQFYEKDYEDRLDPHRLLGKIEAISSSFESRMEYAETFGYLEYSPVKNKDCSGLREQDTEQKRIINTSAV